MLSIQPSNVPYIELF